MAIAVQSTSTATWGSRSTMSLTKPTGLVAGDLMVACLQCDSTTWATPTGWTELQEVTNGGGTTAALMYKIADSGDAAASTFDFSVDSGPNPTAGALLRIDGYASTSLFSDSETEIDNNTATTIDMGVTIDPIANGELIIVTAAAEQVVSTSSVGAPSINGTNPSWTEVLDTRQLQSGADYRLAYVTYGIQATAAQITSFTATISGATANTDTASVIATLTPQVDVTGTFTHLAVTPSFTAPTAQSGVTGTFTHLGVSPTINAPTALAKQRNIANITKNSAANIRNISKS